MASFAENLRLEAEVHGIQRDFEYLSKLEFDRGDLLAAIQEVEQGEYRDAPGVVRETASFPYNRGVIYAAALVDRVD